MKRRLSQERGGALVLVIIIMAVLMILGTVFLSIGLAETRQAVWQEKRTQAYYLAHTGADALATYIINNPEEHSDEYMYSLIDSIKGKTSNQNVLTDSNGSFVVNIEQLGVNDLKIKSIGTVDDVSQTVMATLIRRGLFDNAIYAHTTLTLWSGAKVYGGDVQYGESIYTGQNAEIVDGDAFLGEIDFPDNTFPELPYMDDIILGNHQHKLIDLNEENPINSDYVGKSYDRIFVANNASLTINLSGETTSIVVRELQVNGTINIIGEGRLLLYVSEAVYFKGIVNSEAQHFIIYIGDYDSVNETGIKGYIELKTGNSIFNGYIIGIHATVDITSNLVYTGAIIADKVKVASNAEVYYDIDNAPNIIPEEIDLPPLGYKFGSWIN